MIKNIITYMKLDEKFKCQKCAKCCSALQLEDEAGLFPGYFNSAYILQCCKPSLTLFDWEAKEMAEEAEKEGINFKLIPYKLVYDTKTKTAIILQYVLAHNVCPFLKFNACSIYEKRPSICKLFPPNARGITSGTITLNRSSCPYDLKEKDWEEVINLNLQPKEMIRKIHERYGEIFEAEVEYEIMSKQITDWVNLLILKGIISPAKGFEPKVLLKMASEAQIVPLSMFFKGMVPQKAEEAEKVIEDARQLVHGKKFLEDAKK
ncbi:MAG: YkgJ family cysteine cluster protein [Nanoarchaeota archaeon]|nr:YkgJ family cysteine cluster protein [Nanoarchaeota archaeon]